MSNDADPLLQHLVADLKPSAPLRLWPLWLWAAVGVILAAIYVIAVYHPRSEMAALMHGHWPAQGVVLLKPLLFLATGVSALWGASSLVRPDDRVNARALMIIALLAAVSLIALMCQMMTQSLGAVAHSLNGANTLCFATIVIGGAIGWAALWGMWLRQCASPRPVILGALSGLASASFMAAAYAIHCNMDAPVYIVVTYGLAVAVFAGVAAMLGRTLLKW